MTRTQIVAAAVSARMNMAASLTLVEQAILIHATTPIKKGDFEVYSEMIDPMREELDKLHGTIQNANPSDMDEHAGHYIDLITRILKAKCFLRNLKDTFPPASSSTPRSTPKSSIKLPAIDIPIFTGEPEKWLSFKSIYEAVLRNTQWSDVEKLTFLKTKVQGKPLSLIEHLPFTSTSYQEAWTTLNSRYSNDREIVHAHVKRLFNIPSVKNENAGQVQTLLDTTNECLSALKTLNQPTEQWDVLLVYMTVEKLDAEAKKQWALTLTGTTVPTFKQLDAFLQTYIRGLQACASSSRPPSEQKRTSTYVVQNQNPSSPKCVKCSSPHPIYKCSSFLALSPKERNAFAKTKSLCFNCLRPSSPTHRTDNCPSSSCRTCNGKHNTLLHYPRTPPLNQSQQNSTTKTSNITRGEKDVLLSTAIVKTQDAHGYFQECRVMLDNASQATLISADCLTRLGLKSNNVRTDLTGVGGVAAGTSKGKITLTLYSCVTNDSITVTAAVMQKVTSDVPSYELKSEWDHLHGLTLADPLFYQPGKIDILLGAEYDAHLRKDGKREKDIDSPYALNTKFGWVVTGRVDVRSVNTVKIHHIQAETCDTILQKFWELDSVPTPKFFTEEEKECESSFVKTHVRNIDGRFCVKLPLKNNINQLGYSREQAVRRWKSVEKRLAKNPDHWLEYNKFMREYLDLKHMKMISAGEATEKLGATYYLPHHFVVKPDSTTTKFRVVFDASAKSSTGLSLNDCMYVGPTIQPDIFSLLLNFRTYQIAIKADIAKMFRQFNVNNEHCNLQRIVWREKPTDPIQDFKLLTVTYGTASAPFLSTRCLQQLADTNKEQFPLASEQLEKRHYVDDLMGGVKCEASDSCNGLSLVEKAKKLISELNTIADSAQLSYRKWSSNSEEVLQSIPEQFRESSVPLSLDKENNVKALGIQWNPKADTFTFNQPDLNYNSVLTKREVLSQLAKVYDPLGFLSPITICAKLFMQKLWKCSLGWDERLSEEMQTFWRSYCDNLSNISLISIPRCVNPNSFKKQDIHAFCDASEKAYGTVIYLRSEICENQYDIKLLASKSRVAPIKTVSLPRLELCGALLLTELLQQVTDVLELNIEVFAWTDSMICLQWLNSHPDRWQTFVANRVAKIQAIVPFRKWNHVISADNPADLVSRGVSAKQLSQSSLWWSGPEWLCSATLPSKVIVEKQLVSPNMEEKRQKLTCVHAIINSEFICNFSSLNRLKRSVAWLLRFVENCQAKVQSPNNVLNRLPLSLEEIHRAMNKLVVFVQRSAFSKDYGLLQSKQPVSSKSKLSALNPFIDDEGVMRVGGRLEKANVASGSKHQIILPGNSHFTKLIINHAHYYHGHGGNKLVWCFLRLSYWIQGARNVIRFELRKCVTCRRYRAEKMTQLMGSLPTSRVTPGRVFMHCGVDYAGPFNLRVMKGRSNKLFKGYFCIFICMATKAVHLEAVGDLTTESFIATLKRFVSRRGLPTSMTSDNGTNFKGADNELQQLFQDEQRHVDISSFCNDQGIQWSFIPAAASHHGGLWESGVKSVKYHLKRIVRDHTLTFEEFATILCQVEAYLNSRPLCALSSDIEDYDVLTPGHFIIGQPLTAIPSPNLTDVKVNKLSRWQFTQQISQHFWKRWQAEYLTTLQQRWKWQRKTDNFSVGDLVIIHEEHTPPSKWKLARVIDIHPGLDNCVRVVTLKTRAGTTKRPITKLTPILFKFEQ